MPSVYQIGRVGRVYMAEEATYGTAATVVAGDAVRHLSVKLSQNPRNRVASPERHTHPSQIYKFTRRETASWMWRDILYPSGTLNTLPDVEPILLNGFGSKTNVTLSTTVSATPAPTTTVFTVASAAGLVAGDAVLVNATSGGRQVRFITAIAGAALTVAPALSAAPASGDSVKGCITYKLATAFQKALTIAHYLTSKSYEGRGAVVETLKFSVDANEEMMLEASGPMKTRARPAQTDPTTFTTAGTTPPSGLTASLRSGATAEEFLRASIEIANGFELDNVAAGTTNAQNAYRRGKRACKLTVDQRSSDDITIEDLAQNTTDWAGLLQQGLTEGSIIALYLPVVELEVPDDPDNEFELDHAYKGDLKASTAGNDEVSLALA